MKNWTHIVIHHSLTSDGNTKNDFDSIKKYHVETNGWDDIGYHWVIEYDHGNIVRKQGRDLETTGAHCKGMNDQAIGICLVGNFDNYEPEEQQYQAVVNLCVEMIELCQIETVNVKPHSFYSEKSCPGHKFDWTKFILMLLEALGNGNDKADS